MTSQTHFQSLETHASYHAQYWEWHEEVSCKPALPEPMETSPNTSLTIQIRQLWRDMGMGNTMCSG